MLFLHCLDANCPFPETGDPKHHGSLCQARDDSQCSVEVGEFCLVWVSSLTKEGHDLNMEGYAPWVTDHRSLCHGNRPKIEPVATSERGWVGFFMLLMLWNSMRPMLRLDLCGMPGRVFWWLLGLGFGALVS